MLILNDYTITCVCVYDDKLTFILIVNIKVSHDKQRHSILKFIIITLYGKSLCHEYDYTEKYINYNNSQSSLKTR